VVRKGWGNNRDAKSRLAGRTQDLPRPTRKAPMRGAFSCAREDSNFHGPFGPQGPQPCTGRVDAFRSVQILQIGGFAGRIGRNGRSGYCHGCCHGLRRGCPRAEAVAHWMLPRALPREAPPAAVGTATIRVGADGHRRKALWKGRGKTACVSRARVRSKLGISTLRAEMSHARATVGQRTSLRESAGDQLRSA
jgi:hypothetical protein